MITRQALLAAILAGWCGASALATPPAKLALEGARIITVTGGDIEPGTLVIDAGKIVALGTQGEVEIPYDAMVVDVTGKVLFPGLFSPHSSQGLDRANESLPVTPYLDVYDAIDPSSLSFENALRDGALCIHVIQGNDCVIGGLSRLVHPIGRTIDEMTIKGAVALKMSTTPKSQFDRMSQMATMRDAFVRLEEHLGDVAERLYEAQLKRENKDLDVDPDRARELGRALIRDQDCDDQHRALFQLVQGRLAAWIHCQAATDVGPAIELARTHGFLDQTVFVLGTDAYRAVEELKAVNRPVVLAETLLHQQRDPITGQLRETFVPGVFFEAGLPFALQPNTSASLGERYLGYQAARCVRHGIPRQAALEAITINPARMLGVEQRFGSLEVGKEAYVVVLSGDPLEFDSWVEQAYIRGVLAYDRAEDVRLQKLLGLEDRFLQRAKQDATQTPSPEDQTPEGDKAEPDKTPTSQESSTTNDSDPHQ